jgi:hypothetical protein
VHRDDMGGVTMHMLRIGVHWTRLGLGDHVNIVGVSRHCAYDYHIMVVSRRLAKMKILLACPHAQ